MNHDRPRLALAWRRAGAKRKPGLFAMPNLRAHPAFLASHFSSSRAAAFGRHRSFSWLVVVVSAKAYFNEQAEPGQ
jgi:hypothetical protein